LLFKSLGAVPFIPKSEGKNINTVFVSEHESFVFYNGYGISPMAARISSSGEEIEFIRPALSEDGEVVPPGPLSGPTERISVGTAEVYVVTRDAEGRGRAESQRPRPRRPVLIAWDGELVQLPPLPYDEFGLDEGQFWIQRNVNSFEVPGGRESPFYATSVHCPHYIYQYSLVAPITGEPIVMIVRLDFAAEGASVRPARVKLDIEPAGEFRGKAISCREFATKNEILNGRFGFYKGEIKTKRDESGNGEAYLAVSKALSLKYFGELRAWSESLDSSDVVVSPKVQQLFADLRKTSVDRSAIDSTDVVEMGGSDPGSYLSILTRARSE
jgi:hypothetical protein